MVFILLDLSLEGFLFLFIKFRERGRGRKEWREGGKGEERGKERKREIF